jgi:monoamine oxidase
MDRIPYAFAKSLDNVIHYDCLVTEIRTGDSSVTIAYSKAGVLQTVVADFCICTMPIAVLAQTKNNFSSETQKAFYGMPMTAQYKIAWESPRFWEKENNIYGGISFLKDTVDLVWYPTDKIFSPTGVVIAGFNVECEDLTGKLTPFGGLPSIEAKLDASRAAVEKLHPGRSHLLAQPIYVSWPRSLTPSVLLPTTVIPNAMPPTLSSKNHKAVPILLETTSPTLWPGRRVQSFQLTTPSNASPDKFKVRLLRRSCFMDDLPTTSKVRKFFAEARPRSRCLLRTILHFS